MRINLTRARQRTVLPEGDYLFDIDVADQRQSKQGNPKLHLEYVLNDEDHEEYKGTRVFDDPSLLEQSWFRVVDIFEAALGELEPEDEEGNIDLDETQLVGCSVAVRVTVDDTFDGVPRNKVVRVFPVSDMYDEGSGAEEEAEAPA